MVDASDRPFEVWLWLPSPPAGASSESRVVQLRCEDQEISLLYEALLLLKAR